jgi:metal-responsive CopG/Arc/MetJ family transcriptional regulator
MPKKGILIRFYHEELKVIDEVAHSEGKKRNEVIRDGIRFLISQRYPEEYKDLMVNLKNELVRKNKKS